MLSSGNFLLLTNTRPRLSDFWKVCAREVERRAEDARRVMSCILMDEEVEEVEEESPDTQGEVFPLSKSVVYEIRNLGLHALP